jgi:circadian clock protein KaiC
MHEHRSATGVPGLDEILKGGLLAERFYLVAGNPGSGKTTLALQYLLEGMRVGERCLYITLSESREELVAGAASHGWSLDGMDIVELIADDRELEGNGDLLMYHPSEIELTDTTRRVFEAVERSQPSRMVFDSLSELRLLAQSSLRYRRQILALKHFFHERKCTVMLLDDNTAEGPDLQLQSIAHGVISLESRAPAYGRALRQLQVVKFRGSNFDSGYQHFALRRGGLEVFPRLAAREHLKDFRQQSVPSGIADLDTMLGGGIDRGTATLLIGPPGSGKTTIALQYATAAAARGDHAAVFSFEETRALMLSRSAKLGMPITEGRGKGKIMVRKLDSAEVSPGEFAAMVRRSVEQDGARVLVIDSLNGYLNAIPEGHFLHAQLHEVISYLNNQGVATFLIAAQSGVMGDGLNTPVNASYLCDSVIMLRFFEHRGNVRKAISVLKKRSGPHEESIRQLRFDQHGVHLSEPLMHLRGVLSGMPINVDPDER